MPRRRFRSFRRTQRKRKWEWIYYQNNFGATASLAKDTLADWRTKMGLTAQLPDMTISRIRGHISIEYPSTEVINQDNHVQAGFLVFPSTVAQANVPRPFSDPWNDWMYWNACFPTLNGPLAIASTLANPVFFDIPLDIKSQRKLHNIDDTLWVIVEENNSLQVQVTVSLAIGVKLP